jgi:hypothetical protein
MRTFPGPIPRFFESWARCCWRDCQVPAEVHAKETRLTSETAEVAELDA